MWFHWVASSLWWHCVQVACTWDDVKSLRQDMERSLSSSAVHFRIKLLQAAAQMQVITKILKLKFWWVIGPVSVEWVCRVLGTVSASISKGKCGEWQKCLLLNSCSLRHCPIMDRQQNTGQSQVVTHCSQADIKIFEILCYLFLKTCSYHLIYLLL